MTVLSNLQDTIPDIYKPETNTVILALLTAIAQEDENLLTQTNSAKEQLFVKTATEQGLERLGKSLGVSRPAGLNIDDLTFQKLIPNLSMKPKQIKKAFYETAEVFWGSKISRTNITTANIATFNLNLGDLFKISVDGGVIQTLKIETGDVTGGVATAIQVKIWLSQIKGVTVEVITDKITNEETINIRTNTFGSEGGLEFFTSSAIGTGKLEFIIEKVDILDQNQRFVVYNINPNELLIEIPVAVPLSLSTLRGSHHFHATSAIESPQPPDNKIWQGSFMFNPSGSRGNFTITSQNSTLTTSITAGDSLTSIKVADTTGFTSSSGNLIFDFGKKDEETNIPFTGILNATLIGIDPNITFKKNHLVGSNVNVISAKAPYIPRKTGQDLAVYLPSPVKSRIIVQTILERLKAAGIVLKFIVLKPTYKYLIDSPF